MQIGIHNKTGFRIREKVHSKTKFRFGETCLNPVLQKQHTTQHPLI